MNDTPQFYKMVLDELEKNRDSEIPFFLHSSHKGIEKIEKKEVLREKIEELKDIEKKKKETEKFLKNNLIKEINPLKKFSFCVIEDFQQQYSSLEEFVANSFRKRGFKVLYTKKNFLELPKQIREKIKIKSGIPDLFVFNGKKYFFVEVKSKGDGLRTNQMEWIKEHPSFKVKIAYQKRIEKL